MRSSATAHYALAMAALAVAIEPLLVRARGSSAPAWSHWWCSASSTHGAPHSGSASGLGATLLTPMRALLPHWPHFLPFLLALGTLVYLWRANQQWHANVPTMRSDQAEVSFGVPPSH